MARGFLLLVAAALATTFLHTTFAATYTVGDSTGWIRPTNDDLYDDWSDNKRFLVGDVLVFNFTTGQHDVAEVTENNYDSCTGSNPISLVTNGPARITLNRTGEYHFICTIAGHCSAGQKLSIDVHSGTNNTTNPASPTGVSTTYTVGDSNGWIRPTDNDDLYDDWDNNKHFRVGDVLVFNFTTGQHDVAEVTEDNYESCTGTNPITLVTNGPARITLNRTGEYHFICTIAGHCAAGQKLSINVHSGTNNTSPAPTPASPTTPTSVSTTYTVGDSNGWIRPTNDDLYDDWDNNKRFLVGDVLVFNFTSGQHDVAEVTENNYESCTGTNPVSLVTNGPARITLNRTGEYHFICTIPGHCAAGQKLSIDVHSGTNTTTTAPTPASSTPTVGPSPNSPTAGSSPSTPTGVSTTPSSASSFAATFSLVFVSSLFVFLSY